MRAPVLRAAMLASLVAVFSFTPASTGAQRSELEGILAAFSRIPGLEADFREEKSIALLREPVVSTGRLYFAPPARLARHVHRPSRSSMVLDGAVLRFGDGSRVTELDLDTNPAARALVDAFRAVLAGDLAALLRDFDATVRPGEDSAWSLRLVPRSATARRLVREIVLTGRGVVLRTLEVREASGDVSRTTFSNVDAGRRFSRAELRRIFRVGGG